MRYLVHVIDHISSHKKEKESYEIQESEVTINDKDEICNIFSCDSFYVVESSSEENAIVAVSKTIQTKDENGNLIPFTQLFLRARKQSQTTDFNEISHQEICDEVYKSSFQTHHQKFVLSGYVDRQKGEEKWTEYHKVEFFVCPETKIVEIARES